MRNTIKKFIVLVACFSALLAPAQVLAAINPFDTAKEAAGCSSAGSGPNEAGSSTICQTGDGNPITGPDGILLKVTTVIAIIAGFAAVLIIVLAGLRYITSGGQPDQISQAKKTIIYAAVGLVVIVAGQAIISFIISRI